jgi:hypothetical protein
MNCPRSACNKAEAEIEMGSAPAPGAVFHALAENIEWAGTSGTGWIIPGNPDKMNIAFRAGTGGLHSAEN